MQLSVVKLQTPRAGLALTRRCPTRCAAPVRAQQQSQQPEVGRRSVALLVGALPLLLAASPALALGKDYRLALKEREGRKAALKDKAQKLRGEAGAGAQVDTQVFADSQYALDEEHTTPNLRRPRQGGPGDS